MPKKRELQELALTIAEHQANLTKLGERWGQLIVDQMDDTDRAMIAKLKALLDDIKTNYKVNTQKSVDQLEYIRKKVEEIRTKAFIKAEKALREEAPELIENETKWSARLLSELTGTKAAEFATLTDGQAQKILKSSMMTNKTWEQWWTNTAYGDVMRISNVINSGVVQGWTIDEMIQRIMGTKANNYSDGVLSTNRVHARNLARTLCGGISNQAKDQFYRDNDDVVIGVEWLDTLDGRTCHSCAGLSRRRWKTKEPHPVPPLHPSCRCVLLPVTELTDLGEDVSRPMANADFDALAKEDYEKNHPGKKWEELAYATRKKYYYQAQRDFEKRTGKPAYSQAPGNMKFSDYFHQMTEEQKRHWLGKGRYELWKQGNLDLEKFIPPFPDRAFTVKELKEMDKKSFKK